jgi:uncharacterized membrane protein YraQ (UPF0718 family)
VQVFVEIVSATWNMLRDAGPFLLFGFVLAGVAKALFPDEFVVRHLGGNGVGSIFKAAAVGVPLPLCSCSVVPVALGLRRQGASRAATTSFLVSTPESGVDSIAISASLLDPILTIARPIAAFISAAVSGLAVRSIIGGNDTGKADHNAAADCCHANEDSHSTGANTPSLRLREGLRYSFSVLLPDLSGYLFWGFLLAGATVAFVPSSFVEGALGGGITLLLIALVLGVPVYICATAATPIVAAFIAVGMSPGVALVFLLAGPATNLASMLALTGELGKQWLAVYLIAVSASAVALGLLLDRVYVWLSYTAYGGDGAVASLLPESIETVGAVTLTALIVWFYGGKIGRRLRKAVTAGS